MRSSVNSTVATCVTPRAKVPFIGFGLNDTENAPGDGLALGVGAGVTPTGGGVFGSESLPQAVSPAIANKALAVS